MALESATYINGLVATNPTGTDARAQGDDHIRLLKSAVKATFPNVTGAITATHTELNTITDKADLASPALTGTPAFQEKGHSIPALTYTNDASCSFHKILKERFRKKNLWIPITSSTFSIKRQKKETGGSARMLITTIRLLSL